MTVLLLLGLSIGGSLPAWVVRRPGDRLLWWLSPAVAGAALAAAGAVAAASPPETGAVIGLVVSAALVAAVAGGGPATVAVLRLASRRGAADRGRDHDGVPVEPVPSEPGVLRGGAWIGALERAGVAATLLAGWPEGLAVVLAVKGLGRYPELRAPGAAERFIIGTLASVLWAAAAAGVGALGR